MAIDFNNITEDVIPMNQFRLNYRFTNDKYEKLPNLHLDQLRPLGKKASRFLWDYTIQSNLHGNAPFKKDFFKKIDNAPIRPVSIAASPPRMPVTSPARWIDA